MSDESPRDEQTQFFTTVAPGLEIAHYRVVSKVGAGGMGEVFLANDSKLDRKIALKFLPPHFAADAAFKARFIREARSAAALNHPNIITIHEISEWQGRLFIAMEYVEGDPLKKLIDAGDLTGQEVLDISIQICRGLSKAHDSGIIHRDIKAENILIDAERHVKILDFGLAKSEGDEQLTQTGTAMGTVNYMSPEQAQGMEADNRSDIFSVGVLIYQMLTGQLPFKRANMPATIYAIVHEQPPPLKSIASGVAPQIEQILRQALAKSPEQRYQNIRDLASDLKALSGVPDTTQISAATPVATPAQPTAAPSRPAVTSLAVLYLRNLGSEDDEFLSYGITEDLIVDLSRLGTMRVASMRSILKFKDSDADLGEIAGKLNVTTVLDGSIHKSGEKIRVSAQLVEVESDTTLWAERWENAADSLPLVKQALAKGVSEALDVSQTVVAGAGVGTIQSSDPQAYEFYLRGKFTYTSKKSTADVEVALGLYRQAVDLDPSLLAAQAGVAEILIHKGEYQQALDELRRASSDAQSRDLRAEQSSLLRLKADAHIHLSALDKAWECAAQSLEIARGMGDLVGEAQALGLQINVLGRRARLDEALDLSQRVVEINRDLDDQRQTAAALKNMGTVYLRKGEYEQARRLYQEARELAHKRDDTALEADCIGNIGLTYFHTGNQEEALKAYTDALAIHGKLGERAKEALWTNNIAQVHESRGEYRKALQFFEKASQIDSDLGNRGKYALSKGNAAAMLMLVGEYRQAIKHANEAIAIAREVDFPLVETSASDTLAVAYCCRGEHDLAEEYFNEALQVAEENGLPLNIAYTQAHIGELCYMVGDNLRSREHFQLALEIAKRIGQRETELKSSAYLALLTASDKSQEDAVASLRETLTEATSFGDPRYLVLTKRLLGQLLLSAEAEEAQAQGREELASALELAESMEMVHETKLIRKLLDC